MPHTSAAAPSHCSGWRRPPLNWSMSDPAAATITASPSVARPSVEGSRRGRRGTGRSAIPVDPGIRPGGRHVANGLAIVDVDSRCHDRLGRLPGNVAGDWPASGGGVAARAGASLASRSLRGRQSASVSPISSATTATGPSKNSRSAVGDHDRHADHCDGAADVAHPVHAGAVGPEQHEPRREVDHDADAAGQGEHDECDAYPQCVEAEEIGDVTGDAEHHPIGRFPDRLGPSRRGPIVRCRWFRVHDVRGSFHDVDGTESVAWCTSGMSPIRP